MAKNLFFFLLWNGGRLNKQGKGDMDYHYRAGDSATSLTRPSQAQTRVTKHRTQPTLIVTALR
jgi:hypothetical protein